MDTYLKRAYRHKQRTETKMNSENQMNKQFPFWDYRSRRGSLSTSTCTSSSGSSSYDGCSLSSLSSIRSADTASIHSSTSSSDSDSVMLTSDPKRVTLQFTVDSHDVIPLLDLYQPVLDWVDQDLHLFRVTERKETDEINQSNFRSRSVSTMPSVAVMLFLEEEGMLGYERIQSAKRQFEKHPWKFHHSEQVGKGKINPYPYNSQDYFYTAEDLPLWAVRQVHYGKEHVRIVLFTSAENWEDMLQFYKLITGLNPDVLKDDFCLFTVHTHVNYDVQFALKKLNGETQPRVLDCVRLHFRVPQVGNIVPLFPNVCKPISDRKWLTTDHDGNAIVIDVVGTSSRPLSSTPSESSVRSRVSRQSSQSSIVSLTSVSSSMTSVSSELPPHSETEQESEKEEKPTVLRGFYV